MNNDKLQLILPAKHEYLEVVGTAVTTMLRQIPAVENEAYNIQLAIHEGCANIIDHAYQQQGGVHFEIELEVSLDKGQFSARLKDHGQSFHPNLEASKESPIWAVCPSNTNHFKLTAVPEPGFEQIRGRGLFLMHNLVDQIYYHNDNNCNEWILLKNF